MLARTRVARVRLARTSLVVALGALSATVSACAVATGTASTPRLASDEQAIRAQRSRWVQAAADKDVAGMMQLYADSAIALRGASERIVGKPALLASWTELFARASLSAISQRVEMGKTGDVAFEAVAYEVWAPGARVAALDRGRELVVWRKERGEWRIVQEAIVTDPTFAPGRMTAPSQHRAVLQLASVAE